MAPSSAPGAAAPGAPKQTFAAAAAAKANALAAAAEARRASTAAAPAPVRRAPTRPAAPQGSVAPQATVPPQAPVAPQTAAPQAPVQAQPQPVPAAPQPAAPTPAPASFEAMLRARLSDASAAVTRLTAPDDKADADPKRPSKGPFAKRQDEEPAKRAPAFALPRLPRLFGTVAIAASCLLALKTADLASGRAFTDVAKAQSFLSDEPPVIRIERDSDAPADIYIETAGRQIEGAETSNPLDITPTVDVLEERIAERRREARSQENDFQMREALLKAAEARIEERINALQSLETENPNAPEAKLDQDLQRLVTLYEAMKAKEAARIFAVLDMDVLERVARRMNPRKLADVMAEMDAEPATRLTVRLAGATQPLTPGRPAMSEMNLPRIEGEMSADTM